MESTIYGQIAVGLVQLVIVIGNAVLYVRSKSQSDVGKHDVSLFGQIAELARTEASAAKQAVDTIELKHYKSLLAQFEILVQRLAVAEAKITCQQETIDSLSNKLASRERADKKAVRAAPIEPPDDGEPAGDPDIAALIRQHGIPLNGAVPTQSPAPRQRPFGKPI